MSVSLSVSPDGLPDASSARLRRLVKFAVCLSVALAVLGTWSRVLPAWQELSLWLIAIIGVVLHIRAGGHPVFGPVLLYDMVRSARRPQLATLRCLYGGLLLATLFSVYCRWF